MALLRPNGDELECLVKRDAISWKEKANVKYSAARPWLMDFASRGVTRIANVRNAHHTAITWPFRKGDSVFAIRHSLGCKSGS